MCGVRVNRLGLGGDVWRKVTRLGLVSGLVSQASSQKSTQIPFPNSINSDVWRRLTRLGAVCVCMQMLGILQQQADLYVPSDIEQQVQQAAGMDVSRARGSDVTNMRIMCWVAQTPSDCDAACG